MKEAQIHCNQALIAHYQSAEIAQPGESAFDFPPVLVSFSDFWRLLLTIFAISAMRDQQANPFTSQIGLPPIAYYDKTPKMSSFSDSYFIPKFSCNFLNTYAN